MQARRHAIVLAFLLSAGCAHRSPEFPVGIYDVPPEHFGKVSSAGFNLVVTAATRESLAAAAETGLRIIAPPPASPVSGPQNEHLPSLSALDKHPALFGWYLFDEPDLHLVSPAEIEARNKRLKAVTRKPTVLVFSSGSAVEKYVDAADLLAVDCYPISWGPLSMVAREMHLARLGAHGRPFLAIVQAFDWTAFPELIRTDSALRAPSYEELRCMAYLALAQGARGLLFYTYKTAAWNLEEHPELWAAVSNLAAEVRENSAIFGRRVLWWPARTEYHGAPSEMYNDIFEGRISLSLFEATQPSRNVRRGYYLVAVNTTAEPADFSFKLPFREVDQVPTFCGTNEFQAENGWIRKTYGGYEVCIFGPIDGKLLDK